MICNVWPVGIRGSRKTEIAESLELHWVHWLALEHEAAEVALMVEIVESIGPDHFFVEVLAGVVKPLEILTLNLERESLMLLYRPVLDLIELIKLPLKHVKVATFLSIEVNVHILVFFECVDNFIELWLAQEQCIVSHYHTSLDLVCWHTQSLLIKVFLQRLLAIRLKSIAIKMSE